MQPQTFQPADLGVVAFLVLLEALLSADNALVLALMVRHLPHKLQKRALLYGLGGAFIFRFVAILFAATIMRLWWLQAVGAVYLLFLPYKHFRGGSEESAKDSSEASFWRTVIAVELKDVAFAIDSVLAGVSTAGEHPEKLWVVYLGAIIGIVLLRLAAQLFIKLLDRFPALDDIAYILVAWVGVKLGFMAVNDYEKTMMLANGKLPFPQDVPELSPLVFWSVLFGILGCGFAWAVRRAPKA